MTHDYRRNGTTDLFAALDIATGEVITACRTRHTAADVLAFFKTTDRSVPRWQDIHVVLDNLSAHKAPEVQDWLAHPRRARWHLHFTPTSSSWLNLVQRWFKELTDRRLRWGTFTSVPSSSRPSRRGSATATKTQSHSSGTPQPTKPSRKSAEDEKPFHRSNQRRSTSSGRALHAPGDPSVEPGSDQEGHGSCLGWTLLGCPGHCRGRLLA
jgi:hypothetical protein